MNRGMPSARCNTVLPIPYWSLLPDPLDLTFSTWFFFLFRKMERLVGAMMGWNTFPRYPFFGEQATGAMIGLCVMTLYMDDGIFGKSSRKPLF